MDCYADIQVKKLRNELQENINRLSADIDDIKKLLSEIVVELRQLNERQISGQGTGYGA